MKRLAIIGSAVILAGGWQLAAAQAPGGGGGAGRGGGLGMMSFDAMNTETENSPDHLTVEEVSAFFEQMMAARGAGPGGGAPGGAGAAGGQGGRGGGFNAETMFGNWDADEDGKVTREEFDARPRRGGGPGGPGGAAGAGGPGAAPQQ